MIIMTSSRHGGVKAGLQVGFEKLGLDFDVLGQVFLGGTGTMRTRLGTCESGWDRDAGRSVGRRVRQPRPRCEPVASRRIHGSTRETSPTRFPADWGAASPRATQRMVP